MIVVFIESQKFYHWGIHSSRVARLVRPTSKATVLGAALQSFLPGDEAWVGIQAWVGIHPSDGFEDNTNEALTKRNSSHSA